MNDTVAKVETKAVAVAPPARELRVVEDVIPVLDTARFEQMQRIANAMVSGSYVPQTLRGKGENADRETLANLFRIVNQAVRWKADPFSIVDGAFILQGKLGFEGKVVAAVVNTSGKLKGRLEYVYDGKAGDPVRSVTVTGTFADTGKEVSITGSVAEWKTGNEKWKSMPDQMLAYRGAVIWARRHMPEVMLGIYSDDDIENMGTLRRGEDGVYVPAIREPVGDRPVADAGRGETVDGDTGEVTQSGTTTSAEAATETTYALFDATGKQVDMIAEPMAYARRLDRLLEDANKDIAAETAIKEHNADGIQRLIDEDVKPALIMLGLAAKKKAKAA